MVAWAAADAGATEMSEHDQRPRASSHGLGQGILLAALSIPGIQAVQADNPPERGTVSYRHLDYQDMQPGWDRISVKANAMAVVLPVAGEWSVGGSYTRDIVSGASPYFHSEQLLAGEIEERRIGRDLSLSRYFRRGTLTAGWVDSQESDYTSRGFSLAGSWSTESNNTTFTAGASTLHDRIDVSSIGATQESKDTDTVMVGVTQVLSPVDIVQFNLSRAEGKGFFSDPYKFRDNRPGHRQQDVALVRWNHHFPSLDATSRLGYRYYEDTFGVVAHTLDLEWVQQLPHGWTLTPELRLYAQDDADFYVDPRFPGVPNFRPRSQIQSEDQRLSTFGATTLGLKLAKQIGPDWVVDVEYQNYEQRSDWYPWGDGSKDLKPFRANFLQFGVSWSFD